MFQRSMERAKNESDRHAADAAMRAVLALDPLLSLRGPFGVHLVMLDAAVGALQPAEQWPQLARGLEARGRARLARGKLTEAAGDLLSILGDPPERGIEGRAEAYLASVRRQQGQTD